MSKSSLTTAWGLLHVVAGIAVVVAVDRLVAGSGAALGTRLLVAGSVGLAWLALGVLGLVLVLAARDAMRIGRRQRDAVVPLGGDHDRLAADLRDVGARQAELEQSQDDVTRDLRRMVAALSDELADGSSRDDAVETVLADLDERLDRIGIGLEQAERDAAHGRAALAARLDDVVDRLASVPRPGEPGTGADDRPGSPS